MLDNMAELFKSQWVPGSATFFVFGLILAALLFLSGRRGEIWGRRWVIILASLGYLLSTPLAASALEGLLSRGYAPLDAKLASTDVDAVLILGGGGMTLQHGGQQLDQLSVPSGLRLLEGLRLYRELQTDWLVVSGGTTARAGESLPESQTMASLLLAAGVPEEHILIEAQSSNTHDQALNLPPLLTASDVHSFVLVTSPTHMLRADLTLRKQFPDFLTSLAPAASENEPKLGWGLLPNADALATSRDVFRELIALIYYFLRGWI